MPLWISMLRASGRTSALMPGWPIHQSSIGAGQARSSSMMRGRQASSMPARSAISAYRLNGWLRAVMNCAP